VRLMTKDEILFIINILRTQAGTKTKKHEKFYYWSEMFTVSETEPPQLMKKEKEGKIKPATLLTMIPAEDMFDKRMEVHKSIGKTGRQGMEHELKKFYANVELAG